MKRFRKFLNGELSGWKCSEVVWLIVSCLIICGLSIYWNDTIMGIICSTTGVACVVCTGKGKLSAYGFGLINVVLYAIISYKAGYYGEVMLNVLYYFPMQFYGFSVWKKNMNEETHEVKKRKMNPKYFGILLGIVLFLTIVYGKILDILGGNLSYVDALSTVISVIALVVSIKMYIEQWILWFIVDGVTVFMWMVAFCNGTESMATLLMWVMYLGNAVIVYVKWRKEIGQEDGQRRTVGIFRQNREV